MSNFHRYKLFELKYTQKRNRYQTGRHSYKPSAGALIDFVIRFIEIHLLKKP